MKFIKDFEDGNKISGIYFCKSKIAAVSKNGKQYYNMVLQDKTGTIDAKIWDTNSPAIEDFETGEYIDIMGEVSLFNSSLQLSVRRVRVPNEVEYNVADYMPCSRYSPESMYKALCDYIEKIQNPYLKKLVDSFFVEDEGFIETFKKSSAAKSVHHGFIGGLLEHTFGVVRLCHIYTKTYPFLNYDLLISAALFHDIGKTKELSPFPMNDYTDEGQLVGHVIIGYQMVHDAISKIDGFPEILANELEHCILSHHGELEFGSPKKPAIAEALALSLADLTDARMETMREIVEDSSVKTDWLGYNKFLESNIRKTTVENDK
ncbi:MAG TPA: HD domain-containing protein [Candidatus Alectryocaccobium stercorigallinarum]|nr:HD domain-containing protein [Candidatus Alectryocaccobium stercorigallinarum]